MPTTAPYTYGQLRRGDKIADKNFPWLPPRVIRNVHQARKKGYLVIEFENGERTSGPDDTVVSVILEVK